MVLTAHPNSVSAAPRSEDGILWHGRGRPLPDAQELPTLKPRHGPLRSALREPSPVRHHLVAEERRRPPSASRHRPEPEVEDVAGGPPVVPHQIREQHLDEVWVQLKFLGHVRYGTKGYSLKALLKRPVRFLRDDFARMLVFAFAVRTPEGR